VTRALRTRNLRGPRTVKVRRQLLQFGAFLLLLVCLCGHVAEIFDFWDKTLQTGNDIEYSLVMVALVAGSGFGIAHVAAIVMRNASPRSCVLAPLVASSLRAPSPHASPGYSPPPPLRI
jgi:hypothetical protein